MVHPFGARRAAGQGCWDKGHEPGSYLIGGTGEHGEGEGLV